MIAVGDAAQSLDATEVTFDSIAGPSAHVDRVPGTEAFGQRAPATAFLGDEQPTFDRLSRGQLAVAAWNRHHGAIRAHCAPVSCIIPLTRLPSRAFTLPQVRIRVNRP